MVKNRKRNVFWIILTVMVMGVIFYFSSQGTVQSENFSDKVADLLSIPQEKETTRVSNQSVFFGLTLRKLAHIILFTALGFCLYQDYTWMRWRIPLTLGSGYAYAVLDEIHQHIVGRYGRWQDTLIDLIGILLGMCLAMMWGRVSIRFQRREHSQYRKKEMIP